MSVDDALVGGRYRLVETIGRGGMGSVWRARDELLQRPVAVKQVEVPSGLPAEEQALLRARVLREARAAARLSHPGSVTVFDVLEEDARIDIVMELVEAPSLADVVREQGPLTPEEAATVGLDLLEALDAAHRRGVVHRDVKPGNILVLPGGTVRLTDFGVASLADHPSLTTSGRIIGSPAYMAPEQALGRPAGPPADLWGVGATLYFAVEGRPPFQREGSIPTLTAVVNEAPAPPTRVGGLAPVLAALLDKDPDRRPGVSEVRTELSAVAAGGALDRSRPAWAADPSRPAAGTTGTRGTAGAAAATGAAGAAGATTAADALGPRARGPRSRPTRSGRNWTRPDRSPTEEKQVAALGSAAAVAAAARVAARGRTALQDAAGLTSDVHVAVENRPPSGWSPRWGMVLLAVLVALAALGLAAAWAVRQASDDGSGPGSVLEEGRTTTSAGTGVSAGERSAPGLGAAAPAASTTAGAPASTAPPGSTSAAPAAPTGPVTVPPGWLVYTDATTGYRIAHPPGWTVRAVDDVRVDFVDPASGAYMRVDWVQPPGESAVGAWRAYAPRFAAANPGYQEIRIEPTTFRGLEAAIWEFRYGEGGRLHAVDLGMISGRYGFALNFQAPESHWYALQDIRRGFEGSFVPAS